MKKIMLVVLCLIGAMAAANPIDDQCSQFVFNGAPVTAIVKNTQYLCKKNYGIHYRYDTKTAEYVVQHVTLASISGPAKRRDDFRADPAIPKQHQSLLSDYAGLPFDRGHLSPGADNTIDADIMSESFFLSNMVPQVPNNNRGIWKQLETAVRGWVKSGRDIYVVSGTVYDAGYRSIGNQVGIPSRLFKVVIDARSNTAIAFLMPNAALPVKDLSKYAVSISEVEAATGINFMPALPAGNRIETEKPKLSAWPGL